MKTKKVSGERERIVTVRVPESIHKPARVRASGEDHSFQNILLDCLRRYGANLNVGRGKGRQAGSEAAPRIGLPKILPVQDALLALDALHSRPDALNLAA